MGLLDEEGVFSPEVSLESLNSISLNSGVVPGNQTEESEVRELSRKESGISSGTFFLKGSGLLHRKFANLTFFGLVSRKYS